MSPVVWIITFWDGRHLCSLCCIKYKNLPVKVSDAIVIIVIHPWLNFGHVHARSNYGLISKQINERKCFVTMFAVMEY